MTNPCQDLNKFLHDLARSWMILNDSRQDVYPGKQSSSRSQRLSFFVWNHKQRKPLNRGAVRAIFIQFRSTMTVLLHGYLYQIPNYPLFVIPYPPQFCDHQYLYCFSRDLNCSGCDHGHKAKILISYLQNIQIPDPIVYPWVYTYYI